MTRVTVQLVHAYTPVSNSNSRYTLSIGRKKAQIEEAQRQEAASKVAAAAPRKRKKWAAAAAANTEQEEEENQKLDCLEFRAVTQNLE